MKVLILIVLVLASVANGTWVSPTSYDPAYELYWNLCVAAYDNDISTFASEKTMFTQEPLDLIFPLEIETDKWRLYAVEIDYEGFLSNPDISLLLFYDGTWHEQYNGMTIKNKWLELQMTYAKKVSKARIFSQNIDAQYLSVCEFQINEIPEPATILLLGAGILWFIPSKK